MAFGLSDLSGLWDSLSTGAQGLADQTPYGWLGVGAAGAGGVSDIMGLIGNARSMAARSRITDILSDPKRFNDYTARTLRDQLPALQRVAGSDAAVRGLSGGAGQSLYADAVARAYLDAAGLTRQTLTGAAGALPGQQPVNSFVSILQALAKLRALQGGGQGGGLVRSAGNEDSMSAWQEYMRQMNAERGGFGPSIFRSGDFPMTVPDAA